MMISRLSFLFIMLAVLFCFSSAFAEDVATETAATPPPIEKEIVSAPAKEPAVTPTASQLLAASVTSSSPPAEKIEFKPGTIGTVIEVEGAVTRSRPDSDVKLVPVKPDDAVFINDVIETGVDSRVLVLFIDDSRLTLGSNAGFHVMEYAYETPGMRSHAYISVTDGPFLYASGKLAKLPKPDVKFLAPNATIEFNGATAWGGMFEGSYTVFTDAGETLVENNRGRIRVASGQGTHIGNANAAPERPAAWDNAKVDEIRKTVGLKRIDHIRQRLAFHESRNPLMAAQQKPVEAEPVPVTEADGWKPAKNQTSSRREVIRTDHNIRQQRQEIMTSKPAAKAEEKPAPKKEAPPIERTSSGIRLNAPETAEPAEAPEKPTEQPFPAQPKVLAPKAGDMSLPADPAMKQEELEKRGLEGSGQEIAPLNAEPKKPDAL